MVLQFASTSPRVRDLGRVTGFGSERGSLTKDPSPYRTRRSFPTAVAKTADGVGSYRGRMDASRQCNEHRHGVRIASESSDPCSTRWKADADVLRVHSENTD